jgi:hypothetical protein
MKQELADAARASGVTLDERVLSACALHFGLLLSWNKTHNLTRITDPGEAARKHYLDCLVPLLAMDAPSRFLDVGSGAGFPGLMAALVWPNAEAVLVEPARKRVSFLIMVAAAMKVRVKVESPGGQRAPLVLSRATFSPGERAPLRDAVEQHGEICLWGHRHDLATWQTEVSTWGGFQVDARDYRVDGLEPRCLCIASR